MSSVLTQNYFQIFSMPQRYALDRASLDARYRDLQRLVHPDRYAGGSDQERRISVQRAARINEAYETLRDPLRRGRYLLELRGGFDAATAGTCQDPEFLMQQMELRERLAAVRQTANPLSALDALAGEIEAAYRALEAQLADALEAPGGMLGQAQALIEKMQFFTRLKQEALEMEADLEDELL